MNNEIKNENGNSNELGDASALALAQQIVKVLLEKKGMDVSLYNVSGVGSITDYYVNVTGRSTNHVGSLADELVYLIGQKGKDAARVEGKRGDSWILVDYIDVIVNIFDKSARDFYDLERLLPSEERMDISDLVAEVDKKFEIN